MKQLILRYDYESQTRRTRNTVLIMANMFAWQLSVNFSLQTISTSICYFEDDLKILKVEYLNNHLSKLYTLVMRIQTKAYRCFIWRWLQTYLCFEWSHSNMTSKKIKLNISTFQSVPNFKLWDQKAACAYRMQHQLEDDLSDLFQIATLGPS